MRNKKGVSQKIAALIAIKGLVKTDLSNSIAISRVNLSRFLNRKSEIRSNALVDLLEIVGLDLSEQLDRLLDREWNYANGARPDIGYEFERVFESLDRLDQVSLLDSLISKATRAKVKDKTAVKRLDEERSELRRVRRR